MQIRFFCDTSYDHVSCKLGNVLNKPRVVAPYYNNDMSAHSSTQLLFLKVERKKEIPYKRACEGHRIRGGIESYRAQGYEGAISGGCYWDFPVPPSLCGGCALRGACCARPMGA